LQTYFLENEAECEVVFVINNQYSKNIFESCFYSNLEPGSMKPIKS